MQAGQLPLNYHRYIHNIEPGETPGGIKVYQRSEAFDLTVGADLAVTCCPLAGVNMDAPYWVYFIPAFWRPPCFRLTLQAPRAAAAGDSWAPLNICLENVGPLGRGESLYVL